MKLSIDLPEDDLKKAEKFFESVGTTTDDAVEWFIKTTIEEQKIAVIPKKKKRTSKPVKLTADENGMFRLPKNMSEDVKDWVENG